MDTTACRRTSRNPREERAHRVAHRISTRLYRNGSTRTGHLHWKHITATLVREGDDPIFRGRIAVDRGTGAVEFPSPQQFLRVAREEGIPHEEVERAFGHIVQVRRRTSRRRKAASRPAAAKGFFATLLGMNPAVRHIRRDDAYAPAKRNGDMIPLSAKTVLIPEAEVGHFGSDHGVYLDLGGKVTIASYADAMRKTEPWLTKQEFRKAFGHLHTKGVVGKTPRKRKIPERYDVRSMRLGHRGAVADPDTGKETLGPPLPGINKGQLIMYHKPTGAIMWQAFDDRENFPDKPIWIWYGANKGHFDFHEALQNAQLGKGTGERRKSVDAIAMGIPPMALLNAFDYLLPPAIRRQAYAALAGLGRGGD